VDAARSEERGPTLRSKLWRRNVRFHISGRQLVGSFAVPGYAWGLCSDAEGDIFVASPDTLFSAGYIYEYAHGGTTPIATLNDNPEFSAYPIACSRDPVTGNLAVVNRSEDSQQDWGAILIYPDAQGTPTTYTDPDFSQYYSVAYDNSGDLYVDGLQTGGRNVYAEIPAGSGTFTEITLNETLYDAGHLQWDNGFLLIQNVEYPGDEKYAISKVRLSASSGTVLKSIAFREWIVQQEVQPVIRGDTMVAPIGHAFRKRLGFWRYPKGGKPIMILKGFAERGHDGLVGATISLAPSDLRIRKPNKKSP
jgi:hypothetical protein